MLKRKKITIAAIACCTFFGALSVGAYAGLKTNTAKVDATSRAVSSTTRVYLDPTTNWSNDGAKFAVIVKWDGGEQMQNDLMTQCDSSFPVHGSGVYYIDLNLSSVTNFTGLCFSRRSSDATSGSTGSQWNYCNVTGSASSFQNYVCVISGWDEAHTSDHYVGPSGSTYTMYAHADSTSLDGHSPYYYCYSSQTGSYRVEPPTWPGSAMTRVGDSDVYFLEVDKTWDRGIVNNNNNGRQTEDLIVGDYLTKSSVSGAVYMITGSGSKYGGYWNKKDDVTFSSNYMRVWLNRGNQYTASSFYTFHYWNESLTIDKEVLSSGYPQMHDGEYFTYFDVPKEAVGLNYQFKAYVSLNGTFEQASVTESFTAGYASQLFILSYSADHMPIAHGAAATSANTIPASRLGLVFEGFLSCSNDKDNGYGEFTKFKETWIKDGSGNWLVTDGETGLEAVSIDDFSSESDYSTGANRTSPISLLAKFNMMEMNASGGTASHLFGSINNVDNQETTNSVMIIAIIAVVSATCIGAYVIIRHRRKATNTK